MLIIRVPCHRVERRDVNIHLLTACIIPLFLFPLCLLTNHVRRSLVLLQRRAEKEKQKGATPMQGVESTAPVPAPGDPATTAPAAGAAAAAAAGAEPKKEEDTRTYVVAPCLLRGVSML